jgi:uncharacterized protein (DUF305 family)
MIERQGVRCTACVAASVLAVTAAAATIALQLGFARAAETSEHGHTGTAPSDDAFQELMDQAMNRMHAGMAISPSGDPDVDFARMMIPHHQGAVDMALVELRFGRDERLRRLAQGIIVEQRQEIEVMRAALSHPAPGAPRPIPGSK